jgi:hypothetical protein
MRQGVQVLQHQLAFLLLQSMVHLTCPWSLFDMQQAARGHVQSASNQQL